MPTEQNSGLVAFRNTPDRGVARRCRPSSDPNLATGARRPLPPLCDRDIERFQYEDPAPVVPYRAVPSGVGGERYEWLSARFVDTRAVIDLQDDEGALIAIGLVDDAIRPSKCRAESGVLILSMHDDAATVFAAMKTGPAVVPPDGDRPA